MCDDIRLISVEGRWFGQKIESKINLINNPFFSNSRENLFASPWYNWIELLENLVRFLNYSYKIDVSL